MQAIERLGVLVLRPVATTRYHFETGTGDHRGDSAALGHVSGRVITGPQHQRWRGNRPIVAGAQYVTGADLGVLQRHDVTHRRDEARLTVHPLAARDEVVGVLGLVGPQPFDPP